MFRTRIPSITPSAKLIQVAPCTSGTEMEPEAVSGSGSGTGEVGGGGGEEEVQLDETLVYGNPLAGQG